MLFRRVATPRTIDQAGAKAGSVLTGVGNHNRGLRIRLLQDQAPGTNGPLDGQFVILAAGDNKHASSLEPLLNQTSDAQEILRLIRSRHPGCVSIVNRNSLTLEEVVAPSAPAAPAAVAQPTQ